MRKYIAGLALISSFSLANEITINDVLAKQEQELYKKGLYLFKSKNYEKSYEIFNKLFLVNLDDILINYYLGRNAYELKKYEEAVSAYDRILIQKPNNDRVRVELGQTYLAMGLWAQALDEFTKASQGELPLQVKQRIEKTVAILNDKQTKSIFTIYSLFAMIYDSNINNSSEINAFDIYSPDLNTNLTVNNNSKKESAMIYQAVASLNYKYKLEDDLIWDNNLTSVNLKYINHKEKDVNIVSFTTGPMYYTKNYKTAISLIVDKILLAHENYQFNYYLRPEYTRSLSNNTMYIGALKVGRTNYSELTNSDAKIWEFSNAFRYLSDDFGLFNFKADYGSEKEVNSQRDDVSNDYYNFSISNAYNLFEDYTLQTNINYKHTKFDDVNVLFESKRRDIKKDFSLSLEKKLTDTSVVNLGTTYTKRDSSHEPSSYDKYTVKLSLYMSF